jgi:hypothetical protein
MACLKQKSKVYGILRMNPGTDQLGICFYYKKSRSIQKNIVFGKALLSPCPFSRLSEEQGQRNKNGCGRNHPKVWCGNKHHVPRTDTL